MPDISVTRTLREIKSAVNSIRKPVLMNDVYEAIRRTFELYIKRDLKNRFRGRRYNPRYPRLKPATVRNKLKTVGAKPILVFRGRLRMTVLRTAKVAGKKKQMRISVKSPGYGRFLQARGFDFVTPQTNRERKGMRKYLLKALSKLRVERKRKSSNI